MTYEKKTDKPLISWGKMDTTISTEYGLIKYITFVRNECNRIGKKTRVLINDEGYCCLMD